MGRGHIAVLKSKVILPSHVLCGLIPGTEMLGHKEALKELPDRQWRHTRRIESSQSCRLGPSLSGLEGCVSLGREQMVHSWLFPGGVAIQHVLPPE